MYGIVNKAIEDLVITNYGEESWEKILEKSGVEIDFFISNDPYDDDVTYKLAGAAAETLGITLQEVLRAFGEWWILETGKKSYSALMNAGGNNLKEFLINLPNFHTGVVLMYPNLTPPEFKITDIAESSLCLHYFSKREGLQDFMYGLIVGLGKFFNTDVQVGLIADRDSGDDHDIFKVKW